MKNLVTSAIYTAFLALLALQEASSQEVLGPRQIDLMQKTYEENEIRFKRDFAGKRFEGEMYFEKAVEEKSGFREGNYLIYFYRPGESKDLRCWVEDEALLDVVVEWSKGERVRVTGVVDDSWFRSIQLDGCDFNDFYAKKIAAVPKTSMVKVEGGCFQMGSPASEKDRDSDEHQHQVCVESFEIDKYEVTQALWQAVMGTNPSKFKGDDRPVDSVSWVDVNQFLEKLNAQTGNRYRLPTEAEWEYACRGGGKAGRYCGGDDVDRVAWFSKNSGGTTHPVGGKQSNALGLHDMSGNVSEWTCSEYDEDYGGSEMSCVSQQSDSRRVIRGGSWYFGPGWARAAVRWLDPSYRSLFLGFRLAQDL